MPTYRRTYPTALPPKPRQLAKINRSPRFLPSLPPSLPPFLPSNISRCPPEKPRQLANIIRGKSSPLKSLIACAVL